MEAILDFSVEVIEEFPDYVSFKVSKKEFELSEVVFWELPKAFLDNV